MATTKEPVLKKPEAPEEKKKTITAFLLMFPAVIIAFIAIGSTVQPIWLSAVIIALLILQFVLLEQFVKDYYKNRF